jgi:hypothetical protein
MIKQIDGYYIAAQVRLVRQAHKGTILLLEGATDARVFDRFVDERACDIEIGFGKENVLRAIDLLEEDGFFGVIGIVDADFDRVLEISHSIENICVTGLHDLDLMIFASPAFETYIKEYADDELIAREFGSDFDRCRAKIVEAALPLARCRLISEHRHLRLYFVDLRHDEFVAEHDLSVTVDGLHQTIINRSKTSCTLTQLKSFVASEFAQVAEPYQLVNGHDIAAILGIALRRLIGKRRRDQTWASEVEAGLRLAFDWSAMQTTGVYHCVKRWEAANEPYRVFRN